MLIKSQWSTAMQISTYLERKAWIIYQVSKVVKNAEQVEFLQITHKNETWNRHWKKIGSFL